MSKPKKSYDLDVGRHLWLQQQFLRNNLVKKLEPTKKTFSISILPCFETIELSGVALELLSKMIIHVQERNNGILGS